MKLFNHTHNVRLHITGKERVNPMSCILLEKKLQRDEFSSDLN